MNVSTSPDNIAWERRDRSLQQKYQVLRDYDAAFAGQSGLESPSNLSTEAIGSRPLSKDHLDRIPMTVDKMDIEKDKYSTTASEVNTHISIGDESREAL